MTCNKCGANAAEGTKFCTACGNQLDNVQNTNIVEQPTIVAEQIQAEPVINNEINTNNVSNIPVNNTTTSNEQSNAEKVNVWLVILSWFIPLAGLIIFLTKKQNEPKTAKASGICALVSFILGLIVILIPMFLILNFATNTANEIIKDSYETIDKIEDELENDYIDNDSSELITDILNDWKNYQIRINGVIYTLPMRYQDISLATGFTIKDVYLNTLLEPNHYTSTNLYKDGKLALYIDIINNEKENIKYIDSMVTRVTQTKYQVSQGAEAIVFPGNIKAGDSITEDEIITLFGTPNDKKVYGNNIQYVYLTDTTWTTTNNFKITVVNGIIDEIQLDHRG